MKRLLLLAAAAVSIAACGSTTSELPGKPTQDGWWEVQEKPAPLASPNAASASR